MEIVQEKSVAQSIIEQAQAAEVESGPFMAPKPKKKGAGRPPLTEEEKLKRKAEKAGAQKSPGDNPQSSAQKGPVIETKVLCYPVVKVISNTGVMVLKDKRAAMSMDEAESMAQGLALIFDKYLPDIMQNYGAEMAFALALGQYGTKLYAVAQLQKQERAASQEAGQQSRPEKTEVKMAEQDENPSSVVPQSPIG